MPATKPLNVRYYAVGSDKAVYGNSSVLEDTCWKKITNGEVTDVMVFDKKIYGLANDNAICIWIGGTSWEVTGGHVPDTMTNFIIKGSSIFGLGQDQKVWVSSINKDTWVACTPGWMMNFTLWGGWIYGVGTDKHVYRTREGPSPSSWEQVTHGSVTQVEVFDDIIYGLGMEGAIYKWSGNSWMKIIDGPMTSFAVEESFIFGVGKDNKIYKCTRDWIKTTEGFSSPITLKLGSYSKL